MTSATSGWVVSEWTLKRSLSAHCRASSNGARLKSVWSSFGVAESKNTLAISKRLYQHSARTARIVYCGTVELGAGSFCATVAAGAASTQCQEQMLERNARWSGSNSAL